MLDQEKEATRNLLLPVRRESYGTFWAKERVEIDCGERDLVSPLSVQVRKQSPAGLFVDAINTQTR